MSVDGGTPVATPLHRYLAGLGLHAQQTVDGQGDPTVYLHGDMVRSTMLMTDETGSAGVPPASLAYTAFGEPVTYDGGSETWRVGFPAAGGMGGSPVTRYQYAGGFGYESGLISLQGVNPALPPVTLQHVGERWYDPALGRFVQRDPIGLAAGVNLYAYCDNDPTPFVDPDGLLTECHPEALTLLWQQAIQQGAKVTIRHGAKLIPVWKVTDICTGGQWGARIWYWENGVLKHWDWMWRSGQRIAVNVVETSGGAVYEFPGKTGACGATGLEALPVLVPLLYGTLRRHRPRGRRGRVAEGTW